LGLALFLVTYDAETVIWLPMLAVMGFGIGATMAAASSAVMMSAPEDRAGMAASVEEVSYELGGALGIAILGSVMSAIYTATLVLPAGIDAVASDSLDEALIVAESLAPDAARDLVALARAAFDNALVGVVAIAVAMLFATAAAIGLFGRSRVTKPRKLLA
ncbi:MFS transporter, partial [Rhizobiaceae sp. 2RAB30]